jgi:hypothetical protein
LKPEVRMAGAGCIGAMLVLLRDGIEALKAAKDRLRKRLQSEVQTLEEALHTEYNKVEAAFEGLAVETARQAEHAVNEDARLASLHQLECDKLAAERAKLDAEKAAMEGKWQFQSSQVKLNVRGKRFETSRGTLCMVPDSMLAAMFRSGRPDARTQIKAGSRGPRSPVIARACPLEGRSREQRICMLCYANNFPATRS